MSQEIEDLKEEMSKNTEQIFGKEFTRIPRVKSKQVSKLSKNDMKRLAFVKK